MAILNHTGLARVLSNIMSRFVKSITASGSTITITKGDDTTSTITTPDKSYSVATTSADGLCSKEDYAKINDARPNPTAVGVTPTVTSGQTLATITVNGSAKAIKCPILNPDVSGYTVTASTQTAWSNTPTVDNATGTLLTRVVGVSAGTYSLQNVLQQLVKKSHGHGSQAITKTTDSVCRCDCRCDCDCD